jgi:hypothetical protein
MSNNNGSIWPVVWIVLGIAVVLQMFAGNNSTSNSSPSSSYSSSPAASSSSFEHRYVKERVKLEGYSDSEAQQAADAIIKFHNAQKARGQ